MLLALLVLLLVAVGFVLRELVSLRRQVSSIRQSLEWYAVGLLESRKDGLAPAVREYIETTKQDLIREGLSEGTFAVQVPPVRPVGRIIYRIHRNSY